MPLTVMQGTSKLWAAVFTLLSLHSLEFSVHGQQRHTDFPQEIMTYGSQYGIMMEAGSPVTWMSATQTLTCNMSFNATIVQWSATCEPMCRFQSYRNGVFGREIRFVANEEWNNSVAICHVVRDASSPARDIRVPIMVRGRPTLSIDPAVVLVYAGYNTSVRCRADTPYVMPSMIRWSGRRIGGDGADVPNLALPVTSDEFWSHATLRPQDITLMDRVRCRITIGAVAPLNPITAGAEIRLSPIPELQISTINRVFAIGRKYTVQCSTDGTVIGGLQWKIYCSDCLYQEETRATETSIKATHSFTFTASENWNGVRVRCELRDYNDLFTEDALTVKHLPTLSFSPTFLDVYEAQSYTVSCLATYPSIAYQSNTMRNSGAQGDDQKLPVRWSVTMTGQETEDERAKLKFNVNSVGSLDETLTFQASRVWHQRSISCELSTGDERDAIETRRFIKVNIYSQPTVTIVPAFPIVDRGVNVTLTCIAEGMVSGGLQFLVQCDDCNYLIEPSTVATTQDAKRRLYFTATSRWDDVTVICGVLGTGGWPSALTKVEVVGVLLMKIVQWTVLGLGLAGVLALVVAITLRILLRNRIRQKQVEAILAAQQDGTFTADDALISGFDRSAIIRSVLEARATLAAASVGKPAATEQNAQPVAANDLQSAFGMPMNSKMAALNVPTSFPPEDSDYADSSMTDGNRPETTAKSGLSKFTRSQAARSVANND